MIFKKNGNHMLQCSPVAIIYYGQNNGDEVLKKELNLHFSSWKSVDGAENLKNQEIAPELHSWVIQRKVSNSQLKE